MKKIKIALSIAVLLGTVTVVGMSNSLVASANDELVGVSDQCNCEYENPHSWGVIKGGGCSQESCWHPAD